MNFHLSSTFSPTGDQPQAIDSLVSGIEAGAHKQTLLGITGSGKTFTIANVIQRLNRPTLVISHNKTLAHQLFEEFKAFFPNNAVEYFISYYDYYQPEAYLAPTDTYIEKDMAINAEIEKMRLRATASLLSGRNDVIIVASVSCIYGMADPNAYSSKTVTVQVGDEIERDLLLRSLIEAYYVNVATDFRPGSFRAKGDTIDIFPAVEGYEGIAYRIEMWGDEIERISTIDPKTGAETGSLDLLNIYPANLFVTTAEQTARAIELIKVDLERQVNYFEQQGKSAEAIRLYERVSNDVEMIQTLGYCSGIENYSRYFDNRSAGERPFCLLDYFPDDFLLVVDESHVTIPQVRGMYGGDRSRKMSLVEYGFRLPAAVDNRPLTFDEFEELTDKTIYVSATPAEYELQQSEGVFIEQIIRPTGIPDPIIEVRPSTDQMDDLQEEITLRAERNERTLVTTVTKRLAEELADFLQRRGVQCEYIHSDVDTMARVEIMEKLRSGEIDVLIGVNLLREGLDFPEVSLVAVLDADNQGFLRTHTALTQTAGRAARNVNGLVIFYADTITESMRRTMEESLSRRRRQLAYNEAHGIVPKQIVKSGSNSAKKGEEARKEYSIGGRASRSFVAEGEMLYGAISGKESLEQQIEKVKAAMMKASEEMDFITAAQYRDLLYELIAKSKS